jgi:hypothetical protein
LVTAVPQSDFAQGISMLVDVSEPGGPTGAPNGQSVQVDLAPN